MDKKIQMSSTHLCHKGPVNFVVQNAMVSVIGSREGFRVDAAVCL